MKRALLTAAVLAILGIGTAGVATAAPSKQTDTQVIGAVRIDPNDPTVAYVTARYICQPGDETHLWVSVKQVDSRLPDPILKVEESTQFSAAWSQSHPTDEVTCDAGWHVQTFEVNQTEYPGAGFGELMPGQAYVQFCLFGGDGTFAPSMRFAQVGY
jgi:hypothetical protein